MGWLTRSLRKGRKPKLHFHQMPKPLRLRLFRAPWCSTHYEAIVINVFFLVIKIFNTVFTNYVEGTHFFRGLLAFLRHGSICSFQMLLQKVLCETNDGSKKNLPASN
jgi:hypothetical protein